MGKSSVLDRMSRSGINVAQFISVNSEEPDIPLHINIRGVDEKDPTNLENLIINLIESSITKQVNIRSYSKHSTKGNKFVIGKGKRDLREIIDIINENASKGLNSIINENIDVSDGGVSGVIMGNTIEFSPNDTPRCVEKDGVCSLPREIGIEILSKAYGFKLDLDFEHNERVEFSIHPIRQGMKNKHTIIWEEEIVNPGSVAPKIEFPNNFSKHIGDKVFGLLLLDSLGFNVPYSNVIPRNISPFTFGNRTNTGEIWTRTAPIVKEAGLYTTCKGWVDPFLLLSKEDAKGTSIGAIISQDSVDSIYSGACMVREDSLSDIIEGVMGEGDKFMVGERGTSAIPNSLIEKLKTLCNKFRLHRDILGDVSFEWVYDGDELWVVQLNQLRNASEKPNIIVDGDCSEYIKFDIKKDNLNILREMISDIIKNKKGVELIGNVGITSHYGDILRQYNIPSKITRP